MLQPLMMQHRGTDEIALSASNEENDYDPSQAASTSQNMHNSEQE